MLTQRDISRDKSVRDLGREAVRFLAHTAVALTLLAATLGVLTLNHPDPESTAPKLLATLLAFLIPMAGGFLIARRDRRHTANYVWISGIVVFAVASVRVLDLPTGPGMCDTCDATQKIWRTFFTFTHGSGLIGGDGVLIGAWIPLSMIGYSLGAKLAT